MSFMKPKGPDLRAQQAAQDKQLADMTAAQKEQADLIAAKTAKTEKAEAAQRAVRSGKRRGLLAYTDDALSTRMGG